MNRQIPLFHYTTFESFLKIFYSGKLKFGDAVNLNDILEKNKQMGASNLKQLPLLFALRDTLNSYRQISFTMDFEDNKRGCMSNSMWYHYGDKYNGVCIEFDFEKISLPESIVHGRVSYRSLLKDDLLIPKNAETINDVESFVSQNIEKIFFEKTSDWSYENEYRLICRNEGYLDIENAISAIYFTNCDSVYVKATETIVGDMFPTRYINYYTLNGERTPIDDGTKSMRRKIEGVEQRHKGHKTWMQQAEEYYLENKSDKSKSLIMDRYKE